MQQNIKGSHYALKAYMVALNVSSLRHVRLLLFTPFCRTASVRVQMSTVLIARNLCPFFFFFSFFCFFFIYFVRALFDNVARFYLFTFLFIFNFSFFLSFPFLFPYTHITYVAYVIFYLRFSG